MTPGFIIVSGLPASGKTTLAQALADLTGLALIDKDAILEAMFAEQSIGDAAHRQRLSRASDDLMAVRAGKIDGAILASFWRHPESRSRASGTPVDWLRALPGNLVEVHCRCPVPVALARFRVRSRYPGHLDATRNPAALEAQFVEVARLGPLGIGQLVEVATDAPVEAATVLREIGMAREENPAKVFNLGN